MKNNLNAIGVFIFCGSATFGAERSGFKIDKVLEISEDIVKQNAYHFIQNRKDIPIVLPSEWEKNGYLHLNEKSKNYDLLYANCPCSGLSQINRNASVDSETNIHFYRTFDTIEQVKPKTFLIENAPTLIKKGYPILLDMVKQLGDEYKFTIIRDYAGNHDVAMKRMRTLVVGWRKDTFDNKIPLLHMNKLKQKTVKDLIGDLYNVPLGSIEGHVLHGDRDWKKYDSVVIPYVKQNSSMLLSTIEHFGTLKNNFEDDAPTMKQINGAIDRKSKGQNVWDKTPWRPRENGPAPSLTSVSCFIHPTLDRQWTLREYARLMGFPDDFKLETNECETDIMQCLAQGVPAGFIEYITGEIREALNGERNFVEGSENKNLNFQHHTHEVYKPFNVDELQNMKELESDKTFNELVK